MILWIALVLLFNDHNHSVKQWDSQYSLVNLHSILRSTIVSKDLQLEYLKSLQLSFLIALQLKIFRAKTPVHDSCTRVSVVKNFTILFWVWIWIHKDSMNSLFRLFALKDFKRNRKLQMHFLLLIRPSSFKFWIIIFNLRRFNDERWFWWNWHSKLKLEERQLT